MSRLPAPSQQWTERLQHRDPTVICPACFWIGTPRLCLRGGFVIERGLWGLGLATLGIMPVVGDLCAGLGCLPGLLYSVWRRSRRSSVCPQCGANQLVSEEDAYPPACSHFLFSAERSREPGRTQSWPTVAQETAVNSSMSAIGVASRARWTQNVRHSEQKLEERA